MKTDVERGSSTLCRPYESWLRKNEHCREGYTEPVASEQHISSGWVVASDGYLDHGLAGAP
jgi:hypothetical protein